MRTFLALVLACLFAQSAYSQYIITKGATDKTVYIKIIAEDTGIPDTSIAYDTSGIDLEYVRAGAAAVDITEATQTANGAHSDGGFVHVGHGVYRLDLPDAAIASGADSVEVIGTVTGMTVIGCTIQLTGADLSSTLLTLQQIVDGILDEALSGHSTAGTVGKAILDAIKTGVSYTVDSEHEPTTNVTYTEE